MELPYSQPRVAPKKGGNFYAKTTGFDSLRKFDYSSQCVKNLDNLDYEKMIAIDISLEGQNGVIFVD